MNKLLMVFTMILIVSVPSCHCRKEVIPSEISLNDSAIAIVKDLYLWEEQINKSDINKKEFSNLSDLMKYVRNYSFEPVFNRAVDKWSFAVDKKEWDKKRDFEIGDTVTVTKPARFVGRVGKIRFGSLGFLFYQFAHRGGDAERCQFALAGPAQAIILADLAACRDGIDQTWLDA